MDGASLLTLCVTIFVQSASLVLTEILTVGVEAEIPQNYEKGSKDFHSTRQS